MFSRLTAIILIIIIIQKQTNIHSEVLKLSAAAMSHPALVHTRTVGGDLGKIRPDVKLSLLHTSQFKSNAGEQSTDRTTDFSGLSCRVKSFFVFVLHHDADQA